MESFLVGAVVGAVVGFVGGQGVGAKAMVHSPAEPQPDRACEWAERWAAVSVHVVLSRVSGGTQKEAANSPIWRAKTLRPREP
jgi:hypothetical protein